ncbi:hypothetical protein ACLI4Z_06610 [Natrialbaceae archaeon A-arb3/5]
MSRSNQAAVRIRCPACDTIVNAPVPPGPGIIEDRDTAPLHGTETACRNCEHELELYFY